MKAFHLGKYAVAWLGGYNQCKDGIQSSLLCGTKKKKKNLKKKCQIVVLENRGTHIIIASFGLCNYESVGKRAAAAGILPSKG